MNFSRRATMLITVLCIVPGAYAQNALSPSALEGAWKLRSFTMEDKPVTATGYMLFSGDRYSFITNMERPKITREASGKPAGQMTEEEKSQNIEALRSMTASAGSYSIEGERIDYHQEVTRMPFLVGETEKRKSWFEGDRLMQDFMGGGARRVMEWERVAPATGAKK